MEAFLSLANKVPDGPQPAQPPMTAQPLKFTNPPRIKYPKDFLIFCFRNPVCKKKPKELSNIVEITLDTPRIRGMDPRPPVPVAIAAPAPVPGAPPPYRHPHFSGRSNDRYRNAQHGMYSRPRNQGNYGAGNSCYSTPPPPRHSQGQNGMFPENGQYQMPIPQPAPPPQETDASEFDIRRLYNRREVYNGNRPDNFTHGKPGMYNHQTTVLPEAPTTEQDYVRQLGDSLRNILSIGNGAMDNLPPAMPTANKMPGAETSSLMAAGDENQQGFQKIMDELVTKGTKKVFERKQTLGMLFGLSS